MRFEVFVAPGPRQRIREQAHWIATEQEAPHVAAEWLARIDESIRNLETMPRRFPRARENDWCDYELRQVSIGQFVLLFTILEEEQQVWILHARHGRQLTRPDDLPDDPSRKQQ
jgi:plasmid stabilization system protein ParE